MAMELKLLRDIGLTDGEARVYVALLEIGKSTTGKIIEQSKISPSKIYDVLKRLIEKGLVSYIIEGKVKHFRATPPHKVLDFIKLKEEELESHKKEFKKILPELVAKENMANSKFNAEIFEGNRGLITVFDMSFEESKKGDIVYAFGYPPYASNLFDAYWKEYHKKCDNSGVIRKVIYDYDTWFLKKREKRVLAQQRYLPKGIVTPSWVLVFNDKVATIIATPEQKVCFLVQNKEVVNSYMQYFNVLWKNAKIGA